MTEKFSLFKKPDISYEIARFLLGISIYYPPTQDTLTILRELDLKSGIINSRRTY